MVNVPITNPSTITSPRQAPPVQGPQPVDPYGQPGTDLYDWYSINDALRASQMPVDDGTWQIAGASHTPVNVSQTVANPAYNNNLTPQENQDLGNGDQFVVRPGADYVIGVVNSKTGQMVKLHLSKSQDPSGKYRYVITGRDIQGNLDKSQPGYTNVTRLPFSDGREEMWGTNAQTGAFEKMPGSPADLGNTKGWNDVRQVETTDANGNRVLAWLGTDPSGKPLQPVPGAPPPVPVGKYVPGSVKQVQVGNKLVYRGQNPQTQVWEDIPSLGEEPVKQSPTTIGRNVYTTDANGNLVLASSVAQPHEGSDQWVDLGNGYAKHQIFSEGDWHDDLAAGQKEVRPDVQRASAALKPKGTKYWIPLTGSPNKLIEVTADGNGGYTYEPGPAGEPPRTMTVPGITQPTEISAGTSEFLPLRRDD